MNESTPPLNLKGMLEVLDQHGVEFIVIGGVCGFLHGAPVSTFDLDIVHSRTEANVAALLSALDHLDATSKLHVQKVKPNASHLLSKGHLLLRTKYGDLDVLGLIANNEDYQTLINDSVQVAIHGVAFKMLTLEKLIQTKIATDRPKDRLVIPVLKAVAEARRGKV